MLTVAIEVALLLHEPPVPVVVKVVVAPGQSVEAPVIVPADGAAATTIVRVAVAVPQVLVTEYVIVAVPTAIPVTIPEALIVAIEGAELDHVPPVVVLVNVVVEPAQTVDAPVIVPADGPLITITDVVLLVEPQLLLTV